ncbi:MAG: class I SAM-dependent methyltransferase [Acidobacteriota bacterium]
MPDLHHDPSTAELYDLAFSWDLSEEIAWLKSRLGPERRHVVEPACGSGRLLLPLAEAGFRVAGYDGATTMLERAFDRFRAAGQPEPRLVRCDLASRPGRQLGGPFDAALMPINTFAHLSTEAEARRHLEIVAEVLKEGAPYLVQLDLDTLAGRQPREVGPNTGWNTATEHGTLRCEVFGRGYDAGTQLETTVMRFRFLDGEREGFEVECEEQHRIWDWVGWCSLLADSPFSQGHAFDGNSRERWPLPLSADLEGRPLTWHELRLS